MQKHVDAKQPRLRASIYTKPFPQTGFQFVSGSVLPIFYPSVSGFLRRTVKETRAGIFVICQKTSSIKKLPSYRIWGHTEDSAFTLKSTCVCRYGIRMQTTEFGDVHLKAYGKPYLEPGDCKLIRVQTYTYDPQKRWRIPKMKCQSKS